MMHVVMCTDSAYSPWVATSLRSLVDRHRDDAVTVHVLCDESLGPEDRERLASIGGGSRTEVLFRTVDQRPIADLPLTGPSGRIVWWRLLLADVFPELARVLFIDADTLVLDRLDEMWQTPFDNPLAAVANVVEPALHDYVRSLGIADPSTYLNAGVLIFDLDRMRRENATRRLVDVAKDLRGRSRWADQDALNVVFNTNWHELHPRYNAMNSLWTWAGWARDVYGEERWSEARRSPAVLHFEGPSVCKPWHALATHDFLGEYRKTLARTPYADHPLEDQTVVTALIARLPRRYRIPAYFKLIQARSRIGHSRSSAS